MVVGCADLARSNQPFEGDTFRPGGVRRKPLARRDRRRANRRHRLSFGRRELADHAARGGASRAAAHPATRSGAGDRQPHGRRTSCRRARRRQPASAVLATGANFLALDPASAASAARVVREFCAGWPHPVPAVLNTNAKRTPLNKHAEQICESAKSSASSPSVGRIRASPRYLSRGGAARARRVERPRPRGGRTAGGVRRARRRRGKA